MASVTENANKVEQCLRADIMAKVRIDKLEKEIAELKIQLAREGIIALEPEEMKPVAPPEEKPEPAPKPKTTKKTKTK